MFAYDITSRSPTSSIIVETLISPSHPLPVGPVTICLFTRFYVSQLANYLVTTFGWVSEMEAGINQVPMIWAAYWDTGKCSILVHQKQNVPECIFAPVTLKTCVCIK